MHRLAFFLLLATSPAQATADGPDCWRVRDVPSSDTLRLRAEPSAKAKEKARIPYDTRCLKATAEHRDAGVVTWRKVAFDGQVGWVAQRFLAEDSPTSSLERHPQEKDILAPFAKGRLNVFGGAIDAKAWCNEATLANPDTAEVYALGDAVILLCPGSVDGEVNIVTRFTKGAQPKTKRVSPRPSSHRITDEVLSQIAEQRSPSEGEQVKELCSELTAKIAAPGFKGAAPAAKQAAVAEASDKTLKSKALKLRVVAAGKKSPGAVKDELYAAVKGSWRCAAFEEVFPKF